MRKICLLSEAFSPSELTENFQNKHDDFGGVCSFVGQVRGSSEVELLELLHYEPLTLPGMEELAGRAIDRFSLMGLLMVHRVGKMRPGEAIVCVSAISRHRRAAIEAVDFCMDHLKAAAWFWKREKLMTGWRWIEPRLEDYDDLKRWTSSTT